MHKYVSSTTASLSFLKEQPGPCLRKLDNDLQSSLAQFAISCSAEVKDSFKKEVQERFVTELIENIKEHLPDKDTGITAAFGVFNPSQLPLTPEKAMEKQYGEKEIRELGEHHGVGDSPPINCEELLTEWFDLRVYMILNCRCKSMSEMLSLSVNPGSNLSVAYPNTNLLAQIGLLLLPIATADCERAFSTMRRVKSHLRSEMSNSTLNYCMHTCISIGGPLMEEFDFNTSVDKWSSLKNRRIF